MKTKFFPYKHFLAFLLLAGIFSQTSSSQTWNPVGPTDFYQASFGAAAYTSLAIDGSGTPYIVYQDALSSNKATVKKYDGSNWVTVGTAGFSAYPALHTSIAIDGNGTPYVVYQENGYLYKAIVQKFDGSNWVTVGTTDFPSYTEKTDIAIDQNGTPYVVYRENNNGNKASVRRFDGTDWVQVGSAGFSVGSTDYTSIALDNSGTPYVVYMDNANGGKITVQKFNGSNWVIVGMAGFSNYYAYYTSIAIDGTGTPWVAYQGDGSKAMVQKFDGSSWITMGAAGFSVGYAYFTSIAIDGSGTPYVGYQDDGISGKASAKKFDGSNWITLGTAGISAGASTGTSIVIDGSGTPYIVYRDAGNSNKATVQKFVGSNWIPLVDISFSGSTADYTSIAIDGTGTPYVAYRDNGISGYATVKKFDGSNWVTVGTAGFSGVPVSYTSIVIDDSGTPYVVYSEPGTSYKATVKKFDGSSWVTVGMAGFSLGQANYTSIAIDGNGTPYVVYQESSSYTKATVQKFDGSSWVIVGTAGFSAHYAPYTTIAIDGNDTPYVAYQDWGNSGKATVQKFDGSNWVTVGSAGFSEGGAWFTSIAIDGNNTPYVVYRSAANNYKATVKKFNGSNWVNVGTAGFSSGDAYYTSMAIDNSGTAYVVYQENGTSNKPTVQKFDGNNWVIVGSASFSASNVDYPSIAIDGNGNPYVVFNCNGAYVYKFGESGGGGGTTAPVTTLPTLTEQCYNSTLSVPVTATDFNNIGGISLVLDYDETFLSLSSVTWNSAFTNAYYQTPVPGKITFSWFGLTGVSLTDGETLFTLEFDYIGGDSCPSPATTMLTWDNSDPAYLEFSNPDGTVLEDDPFASYYINGSIEIADNTNPVITTCPPIRNVEGCSTNDIMNGGLTALAYSVTTVTVTAAQFIAEGGAATDNCSGSLTYSYIDASSGSCPIVVIRTWTVLDVCGNPTTCIQTIEIDDTTVPVFTTCPPTRNVEGCSTNDIMNGSLTTLAYSVTSVTVTAAQFIAEGGAATDNCSGNLTYSYIDASSGSCTIVVTRTWTVTDVCGNPTTCVQAIEIDDTTVPVFTTCPPTRNVEGCSTNDIMNGSLTTLAYSVTSVTVTAAQFIAEGGAATDNCSGNLTYSYIDDASSGSCPIVVTRTWTVTDVCGNPTTCVQAIEIDDTTVPVFTTCPPTRNVEGCSTNEIMNGSLTALAYSVTPVTVTAAQFIAEGGAATDNCSGNLTYSYADASAGIYPIVVTRTWTIADTCGNPATCAQTINIDDNTLPTVTCPTISPAYLVNNACTWVASGLMPVISDNCSVEPELELYYSVDNGTSWTSGNANGHAFGIGDTQLIYKAVDGALNENTCTLTVHVDGITVTGSVNYYNTALTSMDNNVTVILQQGGSDIYSANSLAGNYTVADVCPGTYDIVVSTTKDKGGVNTTDAAMVNFWGVNNSPIPAVKFYAGDVIGTDFKVLSNDASLIQQYFLTLGNPTPAFSSSWTFRNVGEMVSSNPGTGDYPQLTVTNAAATVINNMYALVKGDFNGSYTPGAKSPLDETLTLIYGKDVQVGQEAFELPLYAGKDLTVGAVSIIINVPSGLLEVQDIYMGVDPGESVPYVVDGDEVRISWYSLNPIFVPEGYPLLTMVMKLTGSPGEEGIQLSLVPSPLNELADDTYKVIDNAVLVVDVIHYMMTEIDESGSNEEVQLISVPNPFRQTTALVYTLPVNGEVILEIYDMMGNKVKTVVDEYQTAGEYQVKLDENILQPGVYTARLKLETSNTVLTRTTKIISK